MRCSINTIGRVLNHVEGLAAEPSCIFTQNEFAIKNGSLGPPTQSYGLVWFFAIMSIRDISIFEGKKHVPTANH